MKPHLGFHFKTRLEAHLHSRQETKDWVLKQFQNIQPPHIILLEGGLGAGKTQIVKWICEARGGQSDLGGQVGQPGQPSLGDPKELATSPTFSIVNFYKQTSIAHVDLYRIEDEDDLESTGFWEIFSEPRLVFIEWPSKINLSDLPLGWPKIQIQIRALSHATSEDREILFSESQRCECQK